MRFGIDDETNSEMIENGRNIAMSVATSLENERKTQQSSTPQKYLGNKSELNIPLSSLNASSGRISPVPRSQSPFLTSSEGIDSLQYDASPSRDNHHPLINPSSFYKPSDYSKPLLNSSFVPLQQFSNKNPHRKF
jgi:hypothetical protein